MCKKTVLYFLFLFYLSFNVNAQLCEGSLGDPIVEIDFGSGVGRGSALGAAITAFTYRGTGELDEGEYTIATTTSGLKGNAWHITNDHTGNDNGYMMVVNSAVLANEGVFYTNTVSGLCSNTTFEFSAWVMNVLNPNIGLTDEYSPNLTFRISDPSGNILGSYNTGNISQTTSGTWVQYGFFFTLEAETEVVITILNSAPSAHPGNDIALDDIAFKPCGPTITNFINGNSSSNISICQDETLNSTLEANLSSGYSDPRYQWQNSHDNGITWTDLTGETDENLLITDSSIPETFLYRVAIANGDNINSLSCRVTSDEFMVEIKEKPNPLVGDKQQSFCSTQNATLANIEVNASAVWYDTLTKDNILVDTTNLVDGTTYYATQINNGCESDEVLAVLVSIYSPTLIVNDIEDIICDNLNDGNEVVDLLIHEEDITICSDCEFNYFTSEAAANNYSETDLITSPTSYLLDSSNSIIYVRIDSSDNCYQVAELYLNLQKTPIIEINDYIGICEGDSDITIDAGSGFYAYSWSTGDTSQTITISSEDYGNYSVEVTEDHGLYMCSSTKTFEVIASNTAIISSIDIEDWTDTNNTIIINLSDESFGDYEYSLDNINYQDDNVFTGIASGEHTVYVNDKNGCDITKEQVYILTYPKFFTPNSDGYHDTWSIAYSEIEPNMTISIYNRYGKLLKYLNANSSWDGTCNGVNLPTSDYWFVVTREDGKIHKGHFTLKR